MAEMSKQVRRAKKREGTAGRVKVITEAISEDHGDHQHNYIHVEFEYDPEHVLAFDVVPQWDLADTAEALYDISGWGEDVLCLLSNACEDLAGVPEPLCDYCGKHHRSHDTCPAVVLD